MTEYMFMLFDDESWYDDLTDESWLQAMADHEAFSAAVAAAGARIVGGRALQRSSSSTTVHNDGGASRLTTDGPFVETKEAIGGYYMVEAADLDQALALAAKCPAAHVEVRPVLDVTVSPASGTPVSELAASPLPVPAGASD